MSRFEYSKKYVFLPLTTNLKTKGIIIETTDTESSCGSLKKKSIVVTEKISVISPLLLLRKFTSIKDSSFKRIVDNVCDFIQGK